MKPLADAPLLDVLIGRRSRRFAPGFRLNGGPLAFESQRPADPLSLDEGGGRFRNCPSTPGASRPPGAGTSWCTSSAAPGPERGRHATARTPSPNAPPARNTVALAPR
jgi:hypothetical protein